jgi:hypothetical protein
VAGNSRRHASPSNSTPHPSSGHDSLRHKGVLYPRRQLQFADEPGRHCLLAVGFQQVVLIQGQASSGRKYHLVVGEVHFKLYPFNGRVVQVINGPGEDCPVLLQQLNDGRPLRRREPPPDLLVAPLKGLLLAAKLFSPFLFCRRPRRCRQQLRRLRWHLNFSLSFNGIQPL